MPLKKQTAPPIKDQRTATSMRALHRWENPARNKSSPLSKQKQALSGLTKRERF